VDVDIVGTFVVWRTNDVKKSTLTMLLYILPCSGFLQVIELATRLAFQWREVKM
jgi:hypothetical protein